MLTGIGPSTQCIWINSPQSPSSYLKSNNEDFLRKSAIQSWLKKKEINNSSWKVVHTFLLYLFLIPENDFADHWGKCPWTLE